MMDLNKHIFKNDDNKPFHSNGYAQVANGNHLGATANISFNQRQQVDYNRRIIGGYNRSTIGSAYGVLRAKPVINPRPVLRQRGSVAARPRPSLQSYNPYA
jgi:hypothetical protein